MTKKITSICAIALAMCLVMAGIAMAADAKPIGVRVNGHLVEFPDGQPFADENSRTLIPVRFVSEALEAKVDWDGPNQTAIISKDGITVKVKIGSSRLAVTEAGATRYVTMDTAAVAKDGRTYVPIRFVAEALGAYVDYSGAFNVVGIYKDVLTKEQIEEIRSFARTPEESFYEQYKSKYSKDKVEYSFGNRENLNSFEDYHEFEYVNGYKKGDADYYDSLIEKAIDLVSYESEHLKVEFLADSSGVYQSDEMTRTYATVRGIVRVDCYATRSEMGEERTIVNKLGLNKVASGISYEFPLDVHLNTPYNGITLNSLIPLN